MPSVKHVISLGVGLYLFWWLLSGYPKPLLLGLGLISTLLTLFLAVRMEVIDHESLPVDLSPRLFKYWGWLLVEITKSNLSVAHMVLQRDPQFSLTRITLPTSRRSDIAKVTFANSITLTPGTVTLGLHGDTLDVLAITRAGADHLLTGDMDRRVPDREGQA